MQINLKSLSEPDGLPTSLPLAPLSPSSAACASVARAPRACDAPMSMSPLRFTLILLQILWNEMEISIQFLFKMEIMILQLPYTSKDRNNIHFTISYQ